jgi:hypothetical protein
MRIAPFILIVLVGQPVSAQEKPDFSGDWILINRSNAPSNAAQSISVHESFKHESVRGTPVDPPLITLLVERRVNGTVHSELYTVGTISGTVGGTGFGGKSERAQVSTSWDGDRLVIEVRYSGRPVDASAVSEHKEVWSLDVAHGVLLVAVTEKAPGTEPTTTNLMYRRQVL